MEDAMQVSKWGNSLAVRLPKEVVEGLGLKEGDALDVVLAGKYGLSLRKRMSREEAVKALWETSRPLPAGFKFNRDEANER
jgi:antitoxin MazE